MPNWTREQRQVIDTRDKNMLVSAAAGSGKTAVLVERIVQRVLDKDHPVDIDKILVVTFTRAAAAEMRERVLDAINRELEKSPSNPHLLRQSTLVHNAFITTIDSFCNYVVRNYFYRIDVDPGFRIGDEGEMKLMRAGVLENLMEEQYQQAKGEKDSAFLDLIDAYGKGVSDSAVADMILTVYEQSQSYPWPEKWLRQLGEPYQVSAVADVENSPWFTWIMGVIRNTVEEACEETKYLLEICNQPQGPQCYAAGLQRDIQMYEDLLVFEDDTRFYQALRECKYGAIGRKPASFTGDEELLTAVKSKRDEIKKQIDKIKTDYCRGTLEEVVEQMQTQKPFVEEIIRLTTEFSHAFAKQKRKKNVLDFNDVEHFALQILRDEKSGERTETAAEFASRFAEIMIDEYQDSNYIQEEILTAVSMEETGRHNMFMVGDVKQSIYSFRQACPEIFMDKYQRFKAGEEGCIAIDLQKNFRSRPQVLEFANDVFYPLMHKDLGGVEYNDAAALYPGASYPGQEEMFAGEIVAAEVDKELAELWQLENKTAYEAKVTADKINEFREKLFVTDKATGELRRMRYSDVVILMRSPNKLADDMIAVLEENGIPAFAESKTGYFDTTEVRTVLNLLRVVDNPYQDIPLAAVLHSPMFGFSNDDFVTIHQKKKPLIESLREYAAEHPDSEVKKFCDFLDEKRKLVSELPIHRLIELLLEDTGYLSYVTAMPRGANRRANLQKLMDEAVAYESTSYQGLFHFVNYIEQLKKYDVEMGEAVLIGENDDAVSIMSIHKSKGLEFPVVILAGTGRQFNDMDTRGSMILHSAMGMGLDLIDAKNQVKETTLYKKTVARAMKWDMYGEEMRILYVAMTRAKEKMVVLGVLPQMEEKLEKWREVSYPLSIGAREGAKNYLEWVVRATEKKRNLYPITLVSPESMVANDLREQLKRQWGREELLQSVEQMPAQTKKEVEEKLGFVYPFADRGRYKNKYSVSEIKHRSMEELFTEKTAEQPEFLQQKETSVIPQFMMEETVAEENLGALRGTAMHRFMECFDFTGELDAKSVFHQEQKMTSEGRLSSKEQELLSRDKLQNFFLTDLAVRMQQAARGGELYKEKPFVMQANPSELFTDAKKDEESVLIQGIIDAFFVEEGQIVLLDYKTDRVQTKEELVDRYRIQLQLYAKALQRTLGMPVKEIYIYSFHLNETILV